MHINHLQRWLPLLLIIISLVLFFSFGLHNYLSFKSLQQHRAVLISWTEQHFALSIFLFMSLYTLAVAVSVPGAVFLTLAGGFLFGPILGSLFVIFSATLGATLLFIAVRTALSDKLEKRASVWINRMREGFNKNAFSYLLVLRLIPIFPFWVVNIVPALLGIKARVFIMATFIGIIPGSVVYVMVGNGLSHVFKENQTPNMGIIFTPSVLFPLLALAGLSLLPVLYKVINRLLKGAA